MVRFGNALLLSVLLLGGCETALDNYVCGDSLDCLGYDISGSCEDNRRCSFSDTRCDSGRSYGPASGSLTGECVPPSSDRTEVLPIPESCQGGAVIYSVEGKTYRTTLGKVPVTENLSDGLDALSEGGEQWMASSPNGEWLLMETNRFDAQCEDWNCLAVVKSDLSTGGVIKIGNERLHGDDYGAIASSGTLVVFPFEGGPNSRDLFAIRQTGSTWSEQALLTGASTFPFNMQPSINADGSKVVFDCGYDLYNGPSTSICEVDTDGSNFHVVWAPARGAVGEKGSQDSALHHPSYFSDGSIVFSADWDGERLWRYSGSGLPELISAQFNNDNSPCVLPNDCIVSLWPERDGASSSELKVMDGAGGNFAMVRTEIEVTNTGISCAGK